MHIQDSTALVTGANRGIGKAFADALLDRGAKKVYAAVRDVATVTDPRVVPIHSTSPTPIASRRSLASWTTSAGRQQRRSATSASR